MAKRDLERSDRMLIVRGPEISRLCGAENPVFGSILIDERRIEFRCDAGPESRPGRYHIHPRIADVPREEEAAIFDTLGIVPEQGNLEVLANPTAACPLMNDLVVGICYDSGPLTGTCGADNYKFRLASGSLPDGLVLTDESGSTSISGTPATAGDFQYTLAISAGKSQREITCCATVAPAPALCCPLPALVVGAAATGTLSGCGGLGPPYTFAATVPLSLGISIDTNGNITGTPSESGIFSITVTVTDKCGKSGPSGNYSLTVVPAPAIFFQAIDNPIAGASVSQTLTGSGGVGGNYTFSPASLPSGFKLAGNQITGTLPDASPVSWTVTITDIGKNSADVTFTAPEVASPISYQFANVTPIVGTQFNSAPATLTGGIGPCTVVVSPASSFQNGVTMASDGSMQGTPAKAVPVNFTGNIIDSNGNSVPFKQTVTVLTEQDAQIARAEAAVTKAVVAYSTAANGYPNGGVSREQLLHAIAALQDKTTHLRRTVEHEDQRRQEREPVPAAPGGPPAGSVYEVTGTLKTKSGAPVPGRLVRLVDANGEVVYEARTNAQGVYKLRGPEGPSYKVMVGDTEIPVVASQAAAAH